MARRSTSRAETPDSSLTRLGPTVAPICYCHGYLAGDTRLSISLSRQDSDLTKPDASQDDGSRTCLASLADGNGTG